MKHLYERVPLLEKGVTNYFGEQRFGSYSGKKGFIGKALITEDYEEALKIYFTHYIKSENTSKKDLKQYIDKNWLKWNNVIEYIKKHPGKNDLMGKLIMYLKNSDNDYFGAVKLLPQRHIRLYIEAYYSFLWNEVTRRVIEKIAEKKFSLSYIAGMLMFYEKVNERDFMHLKWASFNFRKIDAKSQMKLLIKEAFFDVFKQEGITQELLKKTFFNIGMLKRRNLVLFPKDFKVVSEADDELYPRFKKVVLTFSLPPGSYATMVTRILFKH